MFQPFHVLELRTEVGNDYNTIFTISGGQDMSFVDR